MSERFVVILALVAGLVAGCANPSRVFPTPTFPTPIPIPSPEPTPRLTGACSLLLEADVEAATGLDVEKTSATPLNCAFASGSTTIALTLQRAASWEEFVASFEAAGPVEAVPDLGEQAVFAADTLGGLLMVRASTELFVLSGIATQDTGSRLMDQILARLTEGEEPTPEPLD